MLNFIFLCLSCSLNIFMAYLEYKICPFCKCFSSHCMDSLFLQVSLGFAMLRQHVPHAHRKKKLSKVETLRCAVEYIKDLQSLLQENPHPVHASSNPSPSSFQQKVPATAAGTPFQPQGLPASSSAEAFLHIQMSSQLDYLQKESNASPSFALQKMSHLPNSLQESGQTSAFYEDRLLVSEGNSSRLEPQLLKVPKMEDHFQTPVYSSR